MSTTTPSDSHDQLIDREELGEWADSFDQLLQARGSTNAASVLRMLGERASAAGVGGAEPVTTDYVNTISAEHETPFPGDEEIERSYRRLLRWNAAVMVHRAQRPDIGVGGHISTYAGAATLYEVGLNHFFRGAGHPGGGDQVFFQGHASPGMYARAFLEGRLSETDLDGFRQERSKAGHALPSYPHPRMMSDFWQFPTVSMGIGPMNAIYQAQFNRYLAGRGVKDTSDQHVWAFLGDGEMDEPESRGLLQLAANDGLDNLTFVINCNLQRLDGPVRGNGKIVQELEGTRPRTGTTRPTRVSPAPTSVRTSSGAPPPLPPWSRTSPTSRSGACAAVATTTARSMPRITLRAWATQVAGRRWCWRRPSRATAWERTSRRAMRRTR